MTANRRGSPREGPTSGREERWPQTVKERSTRAHGRRTLIKLLEAAEEEFAANGWHGARMARLAKRAGTAHGTVYAYFTDKDDLLFALWRDAGAELRAKLLAMPELGPGAGNMAELRAWVTEVCHCFRRHAPVFHAVTEALVDEERTRVGKVAKRDQRRVLAHFEKRILSSGAIGIDPALGALCIYAMIEGANEQVYRDGLLVSEDELITGLTEFVQNSLFGAGTALPPDPQRDGIIN